MEGVERLLLGETEAEGPGDGSLGAAGEEAVGEPGSVGLGVGGRGVAAAVDVVGGVACKVL